jgi:MFS family permease
VMKFAVIAGPALGGFIYALGSEVAYGIAAALLVVSLFLIFMIHQPAQPSFREPLSMQSVLAGLVFVWRHKVVLGAISLDLFAVLLGGASALLPMFAKDVLHTGPWGLGLLRSAPAIGALAVAIFLARNPLSKDVGRKMFLAVAVYGVTMLVFGLSTTFWLSMLALTIGGGADMVSVVIRLTLVQVETPDEMRGRVSAVNATFIGASNELGDFRAGAMAEWLGAVGSVIVGGVGTLLVAALWIRLFPPLAKRDRLMP